MQKNFYSLTSLSFLTVVFTLISQGVFAQMGSHMVFFKDKEGTGYSLSAPEEFLSAKSLERRLRQNIDLTEADLPVSEIYLAMLNSIGVETHWQTKWMNGVLVDIVDSVQYKEIAELSFVSKVEFVAPDRFESNSKSKKRTKGRKENSLNSESQNAMHEVDFLHKRGLKGKGVTVAVFDAGFVGVDRLSAFKHLRDNNQIVSTKNFVYEGEEVYNYDSHGSKVMSVLSADDGDYYRGAALEAEYIMCVTEDVKREFRLEEYNWLFAAEYVDSLGADIISSSLGYYYFDDPRMDYEWEDLDGKTAVISQAAQKAIDAGMLVISSAGNEGSVNWKYVAPPADVKQVISVGAVDDTFEKAGFSSFGYEKAGFIKPDLVGLGKGIAVVNSNGSVSLDNGTSFSAPMIAGIAACLWPHFEGKTNEEFKEVLLACGSNKNDPNYEIGYGIPMPSVYFYNAMGEEDFVVGPNPFGGDALNIRYQNDLPIKNIDVYLYNMVGEIVAVRSYDELRPKQLFDFDFPGGVPDGAYILNITQGNSSYKAKIIKQ
ncbi:S8 family peptidase [Aureibacter tunicatorum]|uniref:Peptidase S8/S53 domain-containing protein n=1 Tax=Aureibacter tunicatorum TaxID=866807 RepID=A0AAE3XMY9_9BACT|nr:S8 family peptidase [Aureibacter tunicatorum]MDR6239465.1 hypothetical protein [Aureibacter tunicatorum]BDD04613.1 serine protease [Aureibacter tunicatorum]